MTRRQRGTRNVPNNQVIRFSHDTYLMVFFYIDIVDDSIFKEIKKILFTINQ